MNPVVMADSMDPDLSPAPLAVAARGGNGAPRHWRIALALGIGGMIAVALLLPYLFAMMPELAARIPVPLPVFAFVEALQSGTLVASLGWVGLRLGYGYGLDSPRLRVWLSAGTARVPSSRWVLACATGLVVAVICILVSLLSPLEAPGAHPQAPLWWQGLLASAYGAIVEEVLCRLFLVSLLVWVFARVFASSYARPGIYWSAIVIAALLFGAGHLPALAQIHAFSTTNAAQVVVLNALCGVAYGWLFWRYGLEHAIAAHFSSDIVLHVLAPLANSI